MKVAVGSKNPVKIQAVKAAFEKVWPNEYVEVIEVNVASGVPDQPMSDEVSIKGAKTRAEAALSQAKADYGVGLEGGLELTDDKWLDCGWVVVTDKTGREGLASTIKMEVPPKIMKLIHGGMELGHAGDKVFGKTNSKQLTGFFGLMTDDAIDRTDTFSDAVISALAPFIHPEMFEQTDIGERINK